MCENKITLLIYKYDTITNMLNCESYGAKKMLSPVYQNRVHTRVADLLYSGQSKWINVIQILQILVFKPPRALLNSNLIWYEGQSQL